MSYKMLMAPAIIMGLNYMGIDYTRSDTILYSRILYGVGQVTVLLLMALIYMRIKASNDNSTIKMKKQLGMLEAAKQASAPKEDSEPESDLEEVSVKDYDSGELWKMAKSNLIGMGITTFIHLKWGFVPPLVIQFAMTPMTLWSSPLVQLYLFKKPASGPLARPFKPESADLFGLQKKMEELKAEQAKAQAEEDESQKMKEEAKQRIDQENAGEKQQSDKKRVAKRKH